MENSRQDAIFKPGDVQWSQQLCESDFLGGLKKTPHFHSDWSRLATACETAPVTQTTIDWAEMIVANFLCRATVSQRYWWWSWRLDTNWRDNVIEQEGLQKVINTSNDNGSHKHNRDTKHKHKNNKNCKNSKNSSRATVSQDNQERRRRNWFWEWLTCPYIFFKHAQRYL